MMVCLDVLIVLLLGLWGEFVAMGTVYSATGQSLSTVPGGIPASATQIILSNNLYTTVDSGWFASYSSLTKLVMADNQITTVAPDAFDSSQPINTVDFTNNLLTAIPDFRVLSTSLHTIIVNKNPVVNAVTDTSYLSGFSILWNIEIQETEYQSLDPIKNMALNKFKLLRAKKANLSDIGTLETFNNVYYIDISYNDYLLPSLTNDTFIGVDILKVLIMASLGFTEFPTGLLQPVKDTVEYLTLTVNDINYINGSMLQGFQVLKHLNLGSNQLTQFPELIHVHLTLEYLDLSNNDITNIEDGVLNGFNQLTTFHIGYNQNLKYIPNFGTASGNMQQLYMFGIGLNGARKEELEQFTSATYIYPTSGNVFSDLYNFTALNGTLLDFIGNYGDIGTVSREFMDQMPLMRLLSLFQTKVTCMEEVRYTYSITIYTQMAVTNSSYTQLLN